MKLKITQPGWANFTGNYGTVEFVDGVSLHPVSPILAQRLAALISIETVPEVEGQVATNPSITQLILDNRTTGADKDMAPPKLTTDAGVGTFERGKNGAPYTREQLEAIASEKGINGLREIGEPAGIKGTKIVALIDAIVKAGVVDPASVAEVGGDDATKEVPGEDGTAPVAPSAAAEIMAAPDELPPKADPMPEAPKE